MPLRSGFLLHDNFLAPLGVMCQVYNNKGINHTTKAITKSILSGIQSLEQ